MWIGSDMSLSPAKELLRLLTHRLPPPDGQHHGLMLRDDDDTGLDVAVCVGTEGRCQIIHLDKEDLSVATDELAEVVIALIPPERL